MKSNKEQAMALAAAERSPFWTRILPALAAGVIFLLGLVLVVFSRSRRKGIS
jgi:hypothetical protein